MLNGERRQGHRWQDQKQRRDEKPCDRHILHPNRRIGNRCLEGLRLNNGIPRYNHVKSNFAKLHLSPVEELNRIRPLRLHKPSLRRRLRYCCFLLRLFACFAPRQPPLICLERTRGDIVNVSGCCSLPATET